MDSFEAAKVVHDRILRLETEHVARKIIGYIYLQDLPDQEMIRLALGPDSLIQNLIQKSKTALHLPSTPAVSPPISPTINPSPFLDPSIPFTSFSPVSPRPFAFRKATPYWNSQLGGEQLPMHNSAFKLIPFSDYVPEEHGLQSQFSLDDSLESMNLGTSSFPNDYYCQEAAFDNLSIRGSGNFPNLMDFPVKTCHYFNKGFCKHGSNCRYFHREAFHDSYPHMFGSNAYEVASEDQVFSPGSLEKLELEITELLKSQRGSPVSIASLPMIYYEKYGRTLQAEGYLTESQRHGKAGYSLTKLLERLKNSIQLIGRPHGQHAVILLEDVPKYMADIRGVRNDPGPIVSGSRQIYLTFPAESTFTEEDVSTYFSDFGPVQDVRIPCQQKRMFGFVTFVSADTVRFILSNGNPHYVCGARVLVKPYREKSKIIERKYQEKFEPPFYYHSHPIDDDSELQARWESRLFRRQLMEEHEQALDLETMRLSQLQLARKPLTPQSCLVYSTDEIKVSKDHPRFPSTERVNCLLDVLNNGSTSGKYPVSNCSDQESTQGLNLPDSPFASTVASSISAVI